MRASAWSETHNLMKRFRSSRTTPSWLKAKALQSTETA